MKTNERKFSLFLADFIDEALGKGWCDKHIEMLNTRSIMVTISGVRYAQASVLEQWITRGQMEAIDCFINENKAKYKKERAIR